MKTSFLIVLNCFLISIILYLSSCNSESSANANSVPRDSPTIAKGKNSFENKCASCHNFNEYGMGIGPHLAGVTTENSLSWIKNFIRDPKKAIDSGDTTAQKLLRLPWKKPIMSL